MRLVYPGGQTDWALLEGGEAGVMRHLAGGLAVWAPRVAYGEGRAALPINGRVEAWRPTAPLGLGRHFRRLFPGPVTAAVDGLAAVIGAPPMGRAKPSRCVVGYVAVLPRWDGGSPALGPVLLTADAFGPGGPALVDLACVDDPLERQDASHGLRTGDVVLLGRALLSPGLWEALRNEDPAAAWPEAASPPARRATAGASV